MVPFEGYFDAPKSGAGFVEALHKAVNEVGFAGELRTSGFLGGGSFHDGTPADATAVIVCGQLKKATAPGRSAGAFKVEGVGTTRG